MGSGFYGFRGFYGFNGFNGFNRFNRFKRVGAAHKIQKRRGGLKLAVFSYRKPNP